jgi:hypothetical protein
MFEENSYRRNVTCRLGSSSFPFAYHFVPHLILGFLPVLLKADSQGRSASTLNLLLKEDRSALLRGTYLCKGPGVGSSQGKLRTGQEAVEPEPGLAEENGCLSGLRHLHDGSQPDRMRGTIMLSGNGRCHGSFQGEQKT